jgi:hypothetical protein
MPRTVIGIVTDRRPKTLWTNHEPAIRRIPMAAMDRSKIIADGWKTRLSGGRVPPRSLISLPPVVKVLG